MKATKPNILEVLGNHSKTVKLKAKANSNGFFLEGFVPRIALMDLMNNFHIYHAHDGKLAVVTPGKLDMRHKYE